MKTETRNQKAAQEIINVAKRYTLSPAQFRYVTRIARKDGGYTTPRRPKKLPDFLNPAEIYHLLNASKDDTFTNLLIEFLIFTGLRINEARNLQVRDLDRANNQLKVVSGKGAKDRHVPITNSLLQKLQLFLGERRQGYVFAKKDGKPYSKRALQKRVKSWIGRCGFAKRLSTHSLRHTFACLCLARGFSLEQVKLLMGHTNVKTTEIYAKLELGDVKEKYLQIMQN